MNHEQNNFTLGEICAGISGFGLGFEQAGWTTKWQIELDDINRAVLADRYPNAQQYKDLRAWRSYPLSPVACLAFGFPCQDISNMGNSKHDKSRHGLKGSRSGLFFTIMEIVRHLQPTWLVIENVAGLIGSNSGEDFGAVIGELAQCGYVGFWRVLDAQYFGIPQKRRRLVLVAGLGRYPSFEFMASSAPVESIPSSFGSRSWIQPADAWAGYTLTAADNGSRINIGCELLCAEENGWDKMVERGRTTEIHGLPLGLDTANTAEAYAAGNAFPPPMAKWIAEILKQS